MNENNRSGAPSGHRRMSLLIACGAIGLFQACWFCYHNVSTAPVSGAVDDSSFSVVPCKFSDVILRSELIAAGRIIEREFSIVNHSAKEIGIQIVNPSCGCLEFLIDRLPVKASHPWALNPRAECRLCVRTTAPPNRGSESRSFGVQASGHQFDAEPRRIDLSLKVLEDLVVRPVKIELPHRSDRLCEFNVEAEIISRRAATSLHTPPSVTLDNASGAFFEITSVDEIEVSNVHEDFVSRRLRILFKGRLPPAKSLLNTESGVRMVIKPLSDSKSALIGEFMLHWADPYQLRASPNISFGTTREGQSVRRIIEVRSPDGLEWAIASVRGTWEGTCHVEFDGTSARRSHLIKLTLPAVTPEAVAGIIEVVPIGESYTPVSIQYAGRVLATKPPSVEVNH